MKKYALITVSDKTGVERLAVELEKLGYGILSTSGTARYLRGFCSAVTEVSDLTGFPEILDGRVKTLHPVIHAGILADRDNEAHLGTLREMKIQRIDLVAANLYPFEQTRLRPNATPEEIIENIDIGGPTLIRAAAKNHRGVIVLTDPADYEEVLGYLRDGLEVPETTRRHLAAKAFALVSAYDAGIADYLSEPDGAAANQLPPSVSIGCCLDSALRYGENPHQKAGFYRSAQTGWKVLHGKELSFNNLQDIDSSLRALRLFERPTAVITKHCNPCGIGSSESLQDAYAKAFAADTQSPFGGIVALNRPLDLATAERINQVFTEIIIAPGYESGVLDFLKKKKNRRLIEFDPVVALVAESPWELKNLLRGYLLQEWDLVDEHPAAWKVVSQRQPDQREAKALRFAWKVVSLLRSNAIAITGEDCVYGLGSGQTSRIDSTHLAIWKAHKFGHDISSAVCASDGFFPYRDSVDELHQNGIKAIIQPGGSKADEDVVRACDEYGMALVFTGFRHFRH
ncbi:MAG: bifunctional phosphoribosylaminoimidazolecarboxamide formyltransferase/IMP cyclohydrolase [Candidatus Syntrophosphaera sp.]|nr:bifunctional phosphoribosylaminoimidazolecarboxamide formyltransferase/IMP cyclohydrolase [Candidatus Syntrophosphaera sp.]